MEQADILRDLGLLALGSRLKRLSESFLADSVRIHQASPYQLAPGQFPLIAALDRYGAMTVNEAARALGISQPAATRAAADAIKAGLVESSRAGEDRRFRSLSLSPQGCEDVAAMKREMWPRVEAAARDLTRGFGADLLGCIARLEDHLANRSLLERYESVAFRILDFSEELAPDFLRINEEWIEEMFAMEPHDHAVLSDPCGKIIDRGGQILFVQELGGSVLGTCALEREADGYTALTKMGVKSEERGRGAGEFLLRAVIERAREHGLLDRLFLISNKACTSAIRLYEQVGFEHDDEIMERFGKRYARTDVAMRYCGSASG